MTDVTNPTPLQCKFMFAASWPGEEYEHELWTFAEIANDFSDNPELLSMLLDIDFDEVVYLESCNLCLQRVPDFLRYSELQILVPEWLDEDDNESLSKEDNTSADDEDDDDYV